MKNQDANEKCEYLVGDDTCSAVKETQASPLRKEACHNEFKDRCCYTCGLRDECAIRCDLIDNRKQTKDETPSVKSNPDSDVFEETACGECFLYLRSACPRSYVSDNELWRRQEKCEKFKPKQKVQNQR